MQLRLDQPDLIDPSRARRLQFGDAHGPRIAILNARGALYEGGADEPDLSLKWIPQGAAHYRTEGKSFTLHADVQLLLNRGQAYTLDMRHPSESFVVFFERTLADTAWTSLTGRNEPFPEVPSVAGLSPAPLCKAVAHLRVESQQADPSGARLGELALTVLSDVAALTFERRAMVTRVPRLRRTTREELLRRLARAETYLVHAHAQATLEGAANAAALSQFHLIRIFRAVYGETPLAWSCGKRLDVARNAMLLTSDSIEEIAHCAGYESRTAFDRAFQRRFGEPPGGLRARR
ncbi:MAG TPA: AraC family transcriptional regulator [Pseudomonadales bacterium]|jgi:AraC-like DNA-binding protein|nr:AraC family transcriptional regulator [Pseudomonadales bacterium]